MKALAGERFVLCERRMTPVLFDSILGLCTCGGLLAGDREHVGDLVGRADAGGVGRGCGAGAGGGSPPADAGLVFSSAAAGDDAGWPVGGVESGERGPVIQQDFLKLVRANKERIQKSGGN